MRYPKFVSVLLIAVLGLAAVACGDGDSEVNVSGGGGSTGTESAGETTDPEADTDGVAFPVTVDSNGTEITIETEPTSIVSMTPTGTEMLFAVGAGEAVIAVDDYSTFPPEAPMTDLSAYEPNLEAILGYGPDLVVIGDGDDDIVSGLESAGVPSLVLPSAATLDDTYTQLEKVGVATGHVADAAALVAEMQADIDALIDQIPETDHAPTFYHELDPALYTVTSTTFIGQLYELAGFENIADEVADGNDYPQLSAEFIVGADPDFIFLADAQCCDQTPATVAARPGFDTLSAVTNGNIVELDEDIASRWGPRVVDLLELIIEAKATVDA